MPRLFFHAGTDLALPISPRFCLGENRHALAGATSTVCLFRRFPYHDHLHASTSAPRRSNRVYYMYVLPNYRTAAPGYHSRLQHQCLGQPTRQSYLHWNSSVQWHSSMYIIVVACSPYILLCIKDLDRCHFDFYQLLFLSDPYADTEISSSTDLPLPNLKQDIHVAPADPYPQSAKSKRHLADSTSQSGNVGADSDFEISLSNLTLIT